MAKRSDQPSSSRAITPPKGRPTRPRSAAGGGTRLLGSNAQWLLLTLVVIAALIWLFSTVG